MSHLPPGYLLKLLRFCSPKGRLDDLEGDFAELYEQRSRNNPYRARMGYMVDALTLLPLKIRTSQLTARNYSNLMVKNYIKIAYRNLMKDKAYAFINISGLAIGMACAFIIFTYVKLELSFDTFHEKADQIYRMQHVYSFIGAPIGPAMVAERPEVLSCTRFSPWATDRRTFLSEDEFFYEDFLVADNNFFETFTFEFIAGTPATALVGPESLVITETIAQKYFGSTDVLGRVLSVEEISHHDRTPLKVTGVIKDVPYNSQLQFTHVTSFELIENNPNIMIKNSWVNDWIVTYLVIDKHADIAALEAGYWDFFEAHAGVRFPDPFRLMPLTDVRHHSTYLRADFVEQGDINHIRIFSVVAVLVLLIACINYMNLATAKSAQRAKEVGLRKVMGAFRKQVLLQFLVESMTIAFISLIMASIMVWLIFPFLESLSGIEISQGIGRIDQLVLTGIGVALFTGLLGGSYPAFYLSSFAAADILKEAKNPGRRGNLIRKGLVVVQLVVSVALIIAASVVLDQMEYVKNKDLGFDDSEVLVMNYGYSPSTGVRWPFLKGEISQIPGVLDVAASSSIPGDNAAYWNYRFEGDPEDGDGFPGYYMGPNAVDLLELELVMGRTFSEDIETDKDAFILTEKAWKEAINMYGEDWEEPLGRTIEYSTTNSGDWVIEKTGQVIGVIRDFHSRSLQMPMEAIVIQQSSGPRNLLIKVEAGSALQVASALENFWPASGSNQPFNYQLLEQQYASYYDAENRFSKLLYIFCGLAIMIAAFGLYGLSSFTAQQKNKEIGIRKVMGATVSQIFFMITSGFLKLILISLVLAFPIAWYLSSGWLDNFTYHIDVSWLSFVVAALVAALIGPVYRFLANHSSCIDQPGERLEKRIGSTSEKYFESHSFAGNSTPLRQTIKQISRATGLHHMAAGIQEFRRDLLRKHGRGVDTFDAGAGVAFPIDIAARKPFAMFTGKDADMTNELSTFIQLTRGKQCMLDIGGLYGLFSLVFTTINAQGVAHCIEPSPKCQKVLNLNHQLNPSHNMTIGEVAMGATQGSLPMHYEWVHFIADYNQSHNKVVDMMTVDSYIDQSNIKPDVIKIDVDGYEGAVIEGAKEYLTFHDPIIFLELHGPWIERYGYRSRDIRTMLTDAGYHFLDLKLQPVENLEDAFNLFANRIICTKAPDNMAP